jgi:hypothetical protein
MPSYFAKLEGSLVSGFGPASFSHPCTTIPCEWMGDPDYMLSPKLEELGRRVGITETSALSELSSYLSTWVPVDIENDGHIKKREGPDCYATSDRHDVATLTADWRFIDATEYKWIWEAGKQISIPAGTLMARTIEDVVDGYDTRQVLPSGIKCANQATFWHEKVVEEESDAPLTSSSSTVPIIVGGIGLVLAVYLISR